MKCDMVSTGIVRDGRELYRCVREECKKELWVPKGNTLHIARQCTVVDPNEKQPLSACVAPQCGPGTELREIFKEAGASPDMCSGLCQEWEDRMNRWGVEGCILHRAEIINRIETAMFRSWVTTQMKVGWSISRQPWFKITDPVGCIVDEAIRRASIFQYEQSCLPGTQEDFAP